MSGNQGQGAGNVGMSPLNKELHFIVLQFLYEQGLRETAHRLERDTQLYFDLKYFEELILAGRWAEAEWYLRGYFVDVRGNNYGLKLLFEIYKQKFYEALYRHEKKGTLDILHTEFRSILSPDEDIYKELNHLFSLPDFREHPRLKEWDNPQKARATLCANMRKIVLKCPDLKDKVHFPTIPRSRLRSLVNQSFNWQHFLCERRLPNVAMANLLRDHNCSERLPPRPSVSASFFHRPAQNFTLLPSLSFNVPMSSAAGPSRLAINVSSRLAIDVTGASDVRDSIAPAKRFRPSEPSTSESARSSNEALQKSHNFKKLPTSLSMELHLDSSVVSMDFNPIQQTLLLVGTSLGEISIWDLSSNERICHKCFGLRDNPAFSAAILHALDKEGGFFSVRRVLWSTDGCQFVVAYCKYLVQMYEFSGNRDLQCTFEIDAHKGGLNDIVFSQPIKKMFVVTSGDDGAIRVGIAVSGLLVHTFIADHSAPVLSICPQSRGFNQYILAASSDGKIRSWRYDKDEPEHEFEGLTCSSVSFAATTDGSRLFSCGTIKDGTGSPFLVEWNEPHEGIIRRYSGLSTNTDGSLQLDIAKNHTLAIGDDSMVKFWNLDESEPLCSIDAGGGLPTFPRIRFNSSDSLLAVSANDNFIKILATKSGQEILSPSHLPSTAETSSHMDDEGTSSCRAIIPFCGPETPVAIVDPECNAGTSTSGKGTYAPLSPIIELWSPNDTMISSAMYSCDGEMVYSCMTNQTIIVFTKSFQMRFRINPSAYLSFERLNSYPVIVAARPSQPTQFAIGMTDGGVQIFEPLPSNGQWCRSSPLLIDTVKPCSKMLLQSKDDQCDSN